MDSLPPTYTYVVLGVLGLLTAVYFFSYKRVYGTANTPHPSSVKGKAGTREIPTSTSSSSTTTTTSAKKKKKQPQKQQVVQRKIVEEAGQETGEEAQVLDARVTSFNPYASLEQATNNQQQKKQKQQKVKEVTESPVAPPATADGGAAGAGGKNKKKNKKVKSAQESPQLPHSVAVTTAAATETIKTFQQHVETETIQPDRQILTQVDVTEVVDRDSSTRQLVMQESQIIAAPTGSNGAEVGKKSKKKKKVAKVETPPPPPVALTESEPEVVEAMVQITTSTTTVKESDITTMEIAEEEMTPVGGSRRRRRRGKKGGAAGDFKDEDEQQQQLYEPSPTVDIVERSTHTTETTTVTHGVPVVVVAAAAAVKESPELRSELAKLQEQTLAYENRVKQLEMMNIVMEKENSRLQQQYSQALQAKTEEEVLRLQLERKVRNFEEQEEQLKYTNRVLFEQLSEAKDRERERLRQMETKGVTLSVS